MVERRIEEYNENLTSASFSALLEISTALRTYRSSLVLIGGWVPYLLLEEYRGQDKDFRHVGSIDIDLAVDPETIDYNGYANIIEILKTHGYSVRLDVKGQPIWFSFCKDIESLLNEKSYNVQVDFLTSGGPSSKKKHRHRKVQSDLHARIAEGCEIAFSHNMLKKIRGTLPRNGETELEIKMLDIPGCIGMKGIVLGERYKEKDAYDIFTVVGKCKDGSGSIADLVRPFKDEPGIKKGLDSIRTKFRDIKAEGPSWYARFMTLDPEEGKRRMAEAFATLRKFLEAI